MNVSDDDLDDLAHWEPEQVKAPNLDGWKKHAFRPDKRAEERHALAIPAKIRSFECPACGLLKNVLPTFAGGFEWHYYGQCSHCGTNWTVARHLMRECEACGKQVAMTERNPKGQCKCEEPTGIFKA